MMNPTWNVFLLIIVFINGVFSEEILGCGGFVKSDIPINMSQVQVKLYTKQGSLKDHTDCAPNNGYYFLPLYDKGEYILKIDPPEGWSFEPKEVHLNVDGATDQCSQGIDINFSFKGFAIAGKVLSAGSHVGPKGVKVLLVPEQKGGPQVRETFTEEGGSFIFTPVPPGRYIVQASHPTWQLSKSSVKVELVNGNADVGDHSLTIAGYDVSGFVTSDDEPIKGVSFVLFPSEAGPPVSNVQGCDTSPLPGFHGGSNPLCHVKSDDSGRFVFPCLPPGQYRVMPHYEGPQSIKFDVRPVQVAFVVAHDSVKINTKFQVKGFSVSGRVLSRRGGKGIAGAVILLDGNINSYTKEDGSYHLENMQAGSYSLQVKAADMEFKGIQVKITPNTPQLDDIYPSTFKVCGNVALPRLIPGPPDESSRQVVIIPTGDNDIRPALVETEEGTGEFCHMLEAGIYELMVRVPESEKQKGLIFTPTIYTIEVTDSPLKLGTVFHQLKIRISGDLECLGGKDKCGDIPVVLNLIPNDDPDTRIPTAVVMSHGGQYTFGDVLPGTYQVSVDKDDWCWENTKEVVTNTSPNWTVPTFKQTGYSVTIMSSHETEVEYRQITPGCKPTPPGTLLVKQGTTTSCMSLSGLYEFTPKGCHGYAQPLQKCDLSAVPVRPVVFEAISHTVGGRVLSEEKVNDMFVSIIGPDDKLKTRLGPLKPEILPNGKVSYKFNFKAAEGEILSLVPSAAVLLFSPSKASLVGPKDCIDTAVEFTAEKGRVIEGQVVPVLAGVKITVSHKDSTDVIVSAETSATGTFKFGPLPGGFEYRIKAEKEGYVLTGPDSKGNFNAHKLAEVIVEVLDKADNKPLQGVLLSLSGGESFRRNSQTGADGKRTFSSLSPSEYYLRPMMKEYRFEPSSKLITVKEGATVSVQLFGHQVAFSAYGHVTSLSGEPEEGVVVEAVGQEQCSQYQEETATEASGQFRLRGLLPQCEYIVRVKRGASVNQHLARSTPDGITVKAVDGDISGLKLIVFYPLTQMDLTARVETTSPDHLRSLRAKLCREDSPDSPVHIIKLDGYAGKPPARGSRNAMVLFPSIPLDGRSYFLQLESSLSRATHSYTTHAVHFRANSSFKHIRLSFKPEPKIIEQDLGHSSYMALPLIIFGLIMYFNQHKVFPVLNRIAQTLNGSVVTNVNNGRSSPSGSEHNGSDAVMVEPVLNVRSRKVKPRKT
ncbi:BOS complex subunit NOMO1 [Anabrus simplex]|uniref:BOS complex subunit NOMO1 n=1 Tax=Anabrus simplex TaxID=316456 RepID=UPI0035A3781A